MRILSRVSIIIIEGGKAIWKAHLPKIFEKADDWYIGYVEELPGVNTQGRTLEETRENLREAIELILVSNRELAEKGLTGKEFVR